MIHCRGLGLQKQSQGKIEFVKQEGEEQKFKKAEAEELSFVFQFDKVVQMLSSVGLTESHSVFSASHYQQSVIAESNYFILA